MLRALMLLLLLANCTLFAWSRGWLAPALPGPQAGEREPERLAHQLRPEQLTVLSPKAAAQAAQAARAVASDAAAPPADSGAASDPR